MRKAGAIPGVSDPFDPRENIEAGGRPLRSLMARFDGNLPLVLAAYNAGERAVIGHRGVPPYRETRQYVKRILRRLDRDNAKTSDAGQRERRSEEHTSELQSRSDLVCRLLLEKKKPQGIFSRSRT